LLDVDATWTAVKEERGKGSRKGGQNKRREKKNERKAGGSEG
jgi:hypothetical protein